MRFDVCRRVNVVKWTVQFKSQNRKIPDENGKNKNTKNKKVNNEKHYKGFGVSKSREKEYRIDNLKEKG